MGVIDDSIHCLTYYAIYFSLIRWGLIILTIFNWPQLIQCLAKNTTNPAIFIGNWLPERLRIGAWLILFELLVCENIVNRLIKLALNT